nr:UxaA family hydrolase [Saliphagus sp. LR7]
MSDDRKAIVLDGTDTVATMLEGGEVGHSLAVEGDVELAEEIPFGHKVALRDHERDEAVRKYGEAIGVATEPIRAGEWVHTHNCDSARGRADGANADAAAGGGRP